MAAQDPYEPFDLYASDGAPLGRTKPRALVHRDGDWHRSLHLWVVLRASPDDMPLVVFQRRSQAKDTWPGAVDVAVTGHYRAGEGLSEVLREAEEEVGLQIGLDDVARLGLRKRSHRTTELRDNELQDIYVTMPTHPLSSLVPGPEEVDSLVGVTLDALTQLIEGRATEVDADELEPNGQIVASSLSVSELIPANDGYYEMAVASLESMLRGETSEPWSL